MMPRTWFNNRNVIAVIGILLCALITETASAQVTNFQNKNYRISYGIGSANSSVSYIHENINNDVLNTWTIQQKDAFIQNRITLDFFPNGIERIPTPFTISSGISFGTNLGLVTQNVELYDGTNLYAFPEATNFAYGFTLAFINVLHLGSSSFIDISSGITSGTSNYTGLVAGDTAGAAISDNTTNTRGIFKVGFGSNLTSSIGWGVFTFFSPQATEIERSARVEITDPANDLEQEIRTKNDNYIEFGFSLTFLL